MAFSCSSSNSTGNLLFGLCFQFLEGHPAKYQTRGCRPALGNIPAENVSNLCESALFRLAASVFMPAQAAKATCAHVRMPLLRIQALYFRARDHFPRRKFGQRKAAR